MSFRPSWQATIPLALLAGLFAWLGNWQWQRAADKQDLVDAFAQAPLVRDLAGPDAARFTRVSLHGFYDSERHFLVDNRFFASQAGVHVLTPFITEGGITVLVNRGWLPMAPDRRSLPTVAPAAGRVKIAGMLDALSVPGRKLGDADRLVPGNWPQLLTYPNLQDMANALQTKLYPLVLLLDPDSPGGFAGRDWQPVHVPPKRHRGYAFQWYALAVTVLAAWVFLACRGTGATGREDSD